MSLNNKHLNMPYLPAHDAVERTGCVLYSHQIVYPIFMTNAKAHDRHNEIIIRPNINQHLFKACPLLHVSVLKSLRVIWC